MAFSKRTVDTDNTRQTGSDFAAASAEFSAAVKKLRSRIDAYLAANVSEASESVRNDWSNAQSRLTQVEEYLQNMGKHLNKQAEVLDQTFNSLKIG